MKGIYQEDNSCFKGFPEEIGLLLANTVHGGLLYCKNDVHSTIVYSNDYFFEMIGYTREEFKYLFNNRFVDIVDENIPDILKKISHAVNNKINLDYEYKVRRKDGSVMWIHDTAVYNPVDDSFYVLIMDITAQKTIENMLVQNNMSLESFAYNLPGAIQTIKCSDFTVETYFNKNIEDITGYKVDEIKSRFGGKIINLIHPEDMASVFSQMQVSFNNNNPCEIRYRLLKKDGGIQHVLDKGRTITNIDGSSTYYSVIIDISNIKNDVKDKDDELNVIIDWDCHKEKILSSDGFHQMFGYELTNEHFLDLINKGYGIYPEDREMFFETINKNKMTSMPFMLECRVLRCDARYIWCCIRAQIILDINGNPSEVVVLINNIDNRKRSNILLKEKKLRDSITGLYKEEYIKSYLEKLLVNESNKNIHVLCINLLDFDYIVELHGSIVSNEIIKRIGRTLEREVGNEEVLGRIDKSNFIILCNGRSINNIITRVKMIISSIECSLKSITFLKNNSICVGISSSNGEKLNADKLIMKAKCALSEVEKNRETGFEFYE